MNRKTSILVLGAAEMQTPAIRIAKGLGWNVIVADRNAEAPGVRLADHFERVDLADRDGMVSAARRHADAEGLDGVFTAGTDFSSTVAWVAEKLGLPGMPYEVALAASDKDRMRGVFRKHGLPSPAFCALGAGDDPRVALQTLSLPLVIKPVDNMGARGVRKVESEEELVAAAKDAIGYSRSSRIIIEEYIDGPEFSLDALVYEDQISLCGLADRHIRFPPYFVEMGHTMPTRFGDEVQREITDLFFRGIRALGIVNGAAKGDIKYSTNGAVIGEIAARLSGGYMSGWTYPYSSGIVVTEGALRIAVGMAPGDLKPRRKWVSAERAFISIPGTVARVEGVDHARKKRGVRDIFLRVENGSPVVFPANNVQKCGNVISVRRARRASCLSAEGACRRVFIRLEPLIAATEQFLFGKSEEWIPPAFELEKRTNLSSLARMPVWLSTGKNSPDASTERAAPSRTGKAGKSVLTGGELSVGIIGLPALNRERRTEWHGRSIGAAFRHLRAIAGVAQGRRCDIMLGALFWRAFLKGGLQGGVWVIDSLRREYDRGGNIEELLERWCG